MTDIADLCARWTCFHCGETFTTPGIARDHFGFDPSCDPACRIKAGAERGLVMALRKAEADCDELRHLLHDEASEAYRLYAAQTTRHRAQLMATEEAGYEKGLGDGRSEALAQQQARIEALEGALGRIAHFPKLRGARSQDARDMVSIASAALQPKDQSNG